MATDADLAHQLAHAELAVEGRLVDSSNNALVVTFEAGPEQQVAVYKPAAGERPLWDFPDATLSRREVAAYLLAEALDWPLVPLTVWRDEGPAGPGMCQRWIEARAPDDFIDLFAPGDVPSGWRQILEGKDAHNRSVVLAHSDSPQLQRLAVFDALANNADRKAGHLLVQAPGEQTLWGIDHGVTFHVEAKLRTVLWGFVGEPLPADILETLTSFVARFEAVALGLEPHLSAQEIEAVADRAAGLLSAGVFPAPGGNGPAVPWPIY